MKNSEGKSFFSNVFFKAAVATVVIFVLGLSLGWYLDWDRSRAVRAEMEELKTQADESRVALVFFETFKTDPAFCGVYATEMNAQLRKAGEIGLKLESLREANKLDESYYSLKRQYVLFNTELWLRAESLKKICGSQVTTVIYFYPESAECPQCGSQASELLKLKERCPNKIWLFALPSDLNITIVDMLKQRFAVSSTPSLVVAGRTLSGMQSADSLENAFPELSNC